MTLGDKIRELRVAKGMTLRALASAAGISAPFLSDIEHDRRRTDKLGKIAEVLGVPEDDLQALDGRLTEEMREFLKTHPQIVELLRRRHANCSCRRCLVLR